MTQPLYECDNPVHCYFRVLISIRQILKSRVAPADSKEKHVVY
ncbi:hypothetical protein PROSTU_00809 [Providencia stuartii ATCC 25827]|uniref:Uncharacterized protein n=1 Tax=Providencia stuartii ATCC 25827 TaxID=471874 RepID=A0AA86Z317_PROST|nr:hypothetical protein PROSTU_00809 [Providencia stuartii ATCC 25827]